MFFVGPQLVRVLRRSKPAMGLFFGVLEGVRTSEGRFPKEPAMYLVIRVIMVIIISSNYLFCGNAGVKGRSVAIHQRPQLLTSYHLLQHLTELELNKYKTHNSCSMFMKLLLM